MDSVLVYRIVWVILFGIIGFAFTTFYTYDCIHYRMQTGKSINHPAALGCGFGALFAVLNVGFIAPSFALLIVVIGIMWGVSCYFLSI